MFSQNSKAIFLQSVGWQYRISVGIFLMFSRQFSNVAVFIFQILTFYVVQFAQYFFHQRLPYKIYSHRNLAAVEENQIPCSRAI